MKIDDEKWNEIVAETRRRIYQWNSVRDRQQTEAGRFLHGD